MFKPFVGGNKNDAAMHAGSDVEATAGDKAVASRDEEQQAVLAAASMREQLVKFRTAQINGRRGVAPDTAK